MNPETPASIVLRIAVSEEGRAGEEIRLPSEVAVIGRSRTCDVILGDKSVARQHVRVHRTPNGYRVVDLDSGNGVWQGNRRLSDEVLTPGQRFRIGNTVFECFPPSLAGAAPAPSTDRAPVSALPPPVDDATEYGSAHKFVVRLSNEAAMEAPRDIVIPRRWATLGRGEDCSVVLSSRDVSVQHAKVDLLPSGFRLTDLASTNGVWIDGRRVKQSEIVASGQPFRLGVSTLVECRLPEAAASLASVSVGPPPVPEPELKPEPVSTGALSIETEGEPIDVNPHEPLLLSDPAVAYYIVSGGLDVSSVTVEKGRAVGTRGFFLGATQGQLVLGFDISGRSSGFVAVSKPESSIRRIPLERLRDLAATPEGATWVGSRIDAWIDAASHAISRSLDVEKLAEPKLIAGDELVLVPRQGVRSARGVVWVDLWSGSVLFNDLVTPVFQRPRLRFPLTRFSCIRLVTDEFGEERVRPLATVDRIATRELWQGLEQFQSVVHSCEVEERGLRRAEEGIRLIVRGERIAAAGSEGVQTLGDILSPEGGRPSEFMKSVSTIPLLGACELVGKYLGIPISSHPGADEEGTFDEKVAAISRASGFRARVVALREDWWRRDHGPLVGQLETSKDPVAILPTGPRSYEIADPANGTREPLNAKTAMKLAPFAYTIYRPFPDKPLSVGDVLRFGVRGLKGDLRLLIGMGIVIGLFGTAVPYITGQVIDKAIPEADKSLLWFLGGALLMTAFATAAFKLCQGIATLRVQAKMEGAVQSALWDRLLNLPTGFFRDYSAGDLADRAAGVDQIQQLVSGAGVAAILGAFSGLFYVGLMLTYDIRLTVAAIILTVVFVGVTSLANVLQLRHQRVETRLRGRITGLVLNLISGVSKLRVTGSENHAFRVWAQAFSEQRRVSFAVGRIQNFVTVFNGIFPVIASIVIFGVLLGSRSGGNAAATTMTTGSFIGFNAAFGLFLTAMQALADASLSMLRVVPIYERLKPILVERPEVDATKGFPGKLTGAIELSHIYFRYQENGPYVVNDLSLKIEPGEFVAFVGGSGCGKSTLLRLLLGFETPERGTVLYDDQDLSAIDLRLFREQLGVVLQISRVLPAEIYRNIVGVSSKTIEDAWLAAERAGLAEDIRAMPMGMHTYVSEGGGTLSGGQRQRLMIARAIVNNPKLIFLDEATSALDNHAQAVVSESLDRMEATRIVIAHRLSTVIHADKICFLDGGRIVELGTYQELMEKNGLFAELAKRQMA